MAAVNRMPPIVLIPGAMSTALSWRYQIDILQRNRQIVVPDQHYSLTSINDMARDIAPRLPHRFDLVGWSMGGYIAFELYPLIRDRVRKLILVSTSAQPETKEAHARREKTLQSIEAEGLHAVLSRLFDCDLFDASKIDPHFKKSIVSDAARMGETTLRNQSKAMTSRNDSRASLRAISCEVLVIAGSHDPITPIERSEEIVSLLPRPTLHIVHESGHCSPWEKSEEVNAALQDFLGC